MRCPLLALVLLLAGPAVAEPVRLAALADPAPAPRPEGSAPAPDSDVRCTRDGTACIARSTYIPDFCRTIEAAATAHGIDRGFFARLLWKESLFDAAASMVRQTSGI